MAVVTTIKVNAPAAITAVIHASMAFVSFANEITFFIMFNCLNCYYIVGRWLISPFSSFSRSFQRNTGTSLYHLRTSRRNPVRLGDIAQSRVL